MSIKDKISVHPTFRNFPEEVEHGVEVDVTRDVTMPDEPERFNVIKEYRIDVRIGVFFRCNDVELPHRETQAREQLIYELYKEQKTEAYTALNAVSSGNYIAAREALDKLIQSMQS